MSNFEDNSCLIANRTGHDPSSMSSMSNQGDMTPLVNDDSSINVDPTAPYDTVTEFPERHTNSNNDEVEDGVAVGVRSQLFSQESTDPTMTSTRRNLKTFPGVFSPVALSMFSTVLFLRMGFVIGQAGLVETLVQFCVAYFILYLTILSICAISTNGAVEGGGAYYMISRALGPEFGGSIGLLFFLANTFSCALYVAGCVEGMIDNFGLSGTLVDPGSGIPTDNRWWSYLYCSLILAVCLVVCLIGGAMFARTSVFILVIVIGCVVTVVLSMLIKNESCIPYPDSNPFGASGNDTNLTLCANYTGFSTATFNKNIFGNFTVDYVTGHVMTFPMVFAILFSSVTGIMNGANMSGELKEPSKSIPLGTLSATTFTFIIYIILAFLMAATCDRNLLVNNYNLLQPINIWPPFIAIGLFTTTLSAALGNLIGASRILQALAKDEIFWSVLKPMTITTNGNNPVIAVLVSWLLVQLVMLIGSLNAIAQVASSFFLLSYASTNLACLALDLTSAPNFRPSFRYFSSHTALLGVIGSMVMCFLINAMYASIALAVCLLLVVTLHLRTYPMSWGSVSQALIFHQVRKYLLMLDSRRDHVKFWRPQVLLLVANPRTACRRITFMNDLKKTGLFVLGHVIVGDLDSQSTDPCQYQSSSWLSLVDFLKVKAFVELTLASSVRDGLCHLIRVSGLGGMKPNTVCLGFHDSIVPIDSLAECISNTTRSRHLRRTPVPVAPLTALPAIDTDSRRISSEEYVKSLRDVVVKLHKNLCVLRHFERFDRDAAIKGGMMYVDVWPANVLLNASAICAGGIVDGTCLFMLQLACILRMSWRSRVRLRVWLASPSQSDACRARLQRTLHRLRIVADVFMVDWSPVSGLTSLQYVSGVNEIMKAHCDSTAVVFCYLPIAPASDQLTYIHHLDVVTNGLPPTVLVHGVHPVTCSTL